jgi:SAM-dependent methyltransferase
LSTGSSAPARRLNGATLESILACPVSGRPLRHEPEGDVFVEPESGRRYRVEGAILELLPEEQRDADLGDERFYERHPFGFRDWGDWQDLTAGVESELRELIDETPPDGLFFDIGCGEGRISIYLSRLGRDVVAVDFTRRALENVSEHCDAVCVRANNLCLPFKAEVADLVISTGVIHHTPDPLQALREDCRILKQGGTLYLRTYNRRSLYFFLYGCVGGLFRFLRRRGRIGRFLSDGAFFGIYRLLFRVAKGSRASREKIRSKFENYFMKDLVTFARKSDLDAVLASSDMEVLEYRDLGQSHHYLARKPGRSG